MKLRNAQLSCWITALALLGGCRNAAAPAPVQFDPEAVVAKFSGGLIRRGEIRSAVERRLASVPGPVAPETRRLIVRRVIERQVRAAMLNAEATAKGYAERPEVLLSAQAAEEQLLASDLVASQVESVHAAEPLVAAAVDRRLQAAHPEEARKFSHIFLRAPESDPAARSAARASMEKIVSELRAGAGFNALAERYSNSVTARGGGRIEWTLRKDLQRAAADVVFGLREGEVSAVVETRDGLHLFRLDAIRSANPVDVDAVRGAVRKELDTEARATAERTLRQQQLDAAGVEFASPRRLAQLSAGGDDWAARWSGGEVRLQELGTLLGAEDEARPEAAGRALRALVENRLLAARRRAMGLTPDLEAQIASRRRDEVLKAYRADLVGEILTEPTAEEIARYYRENVERALFLRDYRLDVLFFPQTGESVADVYAAGEQVGSALRRGTPFDELLAHPVRPDAKLCRDVHDLAIEELGKRSLRLRKAVLDLEVGGVSPALYLNGPRTVVEEGACVFESRGVAFVRLREIRALALESVQDRIRAVVAEQKERAAIETVQARLIARSGLEILLPEG